MSDTKGGDGDVLRFALVAALAAYVAGVVLLAGRGFLSPRVVVPIGIAVQAVPLAAPLLMSGDVYAYANWALADEPYAGEHPNEPTGSLYGPLWTLASTPIAHLHDYAFVFRLLAFALIVVVAALAAGLARSAPFAFAFVAWNPLVALHFSGGGHNDALLLALVLGALALERRRRPALAGATWMASIFVKWVSAPFLVLHAVARRPPPRRFVVGGAVVAGVVVAVSFALWGTMWLHVVRSLAEASRQEASIGLPAWLSHVGVGRAIGLRLATLAQVAAFGVLLAVAWRRRACLGTAACVLAVLQPRLNPWYASWGVALAAADDEDRIGRVAAILLTALLLTDAIPR